MTSAWPLVLICPPDRSSPSIAATTTFASLPAGSSGGVFFVIRPLHHMVYEVIESRPPPPTSNILTDQIIRFTSKKAQQTFKHPLRRSRRLGRGSMSARSCS